MALVARILMGVTSVLMVAYMVLICSLVMIGNYDEIWELADFPPQDFAPSSIGIALGLFFAVVVVGGLLMTFWQSHLLLKLGRTHLFRALAHRLRLCGVGLTLMWVGLYAFMNLVPLTLSMGRVAPDLMDIEWSPFEIETVFLVLAAVMVALSETLTRAAEIEDENNQFL
ncbi:MULTISPECIES: hypothetical protein [Pseudophaeobacter]|uniref:DUF2975 domain-containing protein n=1 Tax=Pseudophaeobacter arcticus TaxID=385492 RepID=A0ABQ0ANF3_9RHOB|nr:hypothetical protein [Pseudophaeobacter sp.]